MEIRMLKIIILKLLICSIITNCRNSDDKNEVNSIENIPDEEDAATVTDDFSVPTVRKVNTFADSTTTPNFYTVDENVRSTTKEETKEALSTERNTKAFMTEIYVVRTTYNWFHTTNSYGYDYNWHGDLVMEDIELLLLQNKTQYFLSTFEPGYQRDVITMQLQFCPYTRLCGFSFGLSPPRFQNACCQECSCDFPACMNNKTCCPDIILSHINMFNSTAVNVDLPSYLVGQKLQKHCIPLSMSKEPDYAKHSVFGYSTCPSDTDVKLLENCTRQYSANITALNDTIPVMSQDTNELYRNKYCALCNGVPINKFKTSHFRLSCKANTLIATDKDTINAVFAEGDCDVEFLSEDNLDDCDNGISKCNITGGFEESVCSMYISVIYVNEAKFQNVFCSLCNGAVPEEFMCSLNTIHRTSKAFSFSGLLKLDNIGPLEYSVKSAGKCSENQLYDAILDSCRDMVCSDITVLSHGECIDIFEKLEMITYTTFLRLKPIKTVSIVDAYSVADDVIDHMREYLNESFLCGMQMLYKLNMTFQQNQKYAVQNSSLIYFEIRIQYHVRLIHDPYAVAGEILKLHGTKETFRSNKGKKPFTFKFEIRDNNPGKFDIISFLSKSDELHDGLYGYIDDIEALNLTFLLQNYATSGNDDSTIIPHLRVSDDIGLCEIEKQELNILWLTRCPRVNISFSDVPWVETADGVTILLGDYTVKNADYYFVDENHIMLCADQYRQYMTHISNLSPTDPFSAEAIVSIACSVVSILALCFTFSIFCFFSQLRQTLPGKNNMSLIFTLLTAQSIYLIGSFSGLERNSVECVILGILIHFSWLVALFWMNICTFHMFRVLARTKVMSHSSGTKRLMIYHVYAQTMAAIFVSTNIALSYNKHGDIGYGGDACYISSQEMIIYTFGIPTGVIILSNLFMFIFVIVKIKRSPAVQKSVQNERNDIIVFAKLSTITGLTWTFGFLYIWTNVIAMSYLFILMNASQGIFIMFAFVINKRVLDLFKGKVLGLTVTATDSLHPTSKSSVYTTKS